MAESGTSNAVQPHERLGGADEEDPRRRARERAGPVCHLTSVHPPFDVRIFAKECRTLAAAGYRVHLVAPEAPEGVVDGVTLSGVRPSVVRWARMTLTTWRVVMRGLASGATLFHIHDPELLPAGFALRALGKRVIYDVHENVVEQIRSKTYLPGLVRWAAANLVDLLEQASGRLFSGIVGVTPGITARVAGDRGVVVQNFPLADEVEAVQLPYSAREMRGAYAGSITEIRGIREMINALGLLPQDIDCGFDLAGEFWPESLLEEMQALPGWGRVSYHGVVSRPARIALFGRARFGVLAFQPLPNHVHSQPNKLFEYMAAGLPVIASDFPRWREVLDGARCGVLFDPTDPRQLADAIVRLLTNPDEAERMGSRARAAVRQNFVWENEGRRLVEMYDRLLDVGA